MKRVLRPASPLLGIILGFAGSAHCESPFKDGQIHLVQSSHHDLGWHKGSYEAEMEFTFDEIDKALDLMKEDPDFIFTGEYTVWLHEYLTRRPKRAKELKKRVAEGRMEWGAGYTQPYTSLITGEQLARQMYYGRRWFNREFPGRATIYFNTDIPGFGMQMPQILSKAGVDKVFLSRSVNLAGIGTDFVRWAAPDGSEVFCYFMNHYGDNVGAYRRKSTNKNEQMAKWAASLESHYTSREIPPHLIQFLCMDCLPPSSYRDRIDLWNEYAAGKGLPRMDYSTLGRAMDAVRSERAVFKKLSGEWPNKWIYEGAPSNYQLILTQRQSSHLLTAAEAFSTFRALADGGFDNYPAQALDHAWKQSIFACHGFAPDSVLDVFARVWTASRNAAKQALQDSLTAMTARVNTTSRGLPLVVYNTLSWDRTDIVDAEIPPDAPPAFRIVDSRGAEVPHQITQDKQVVFRAEDVPSLGYRTYYLVRDDGPAKPQALAQSDSAWKGPFENEFFMIEPGSGGVKRIYDKDLGRELLRTDKFQGAEWLDYCYEAIAAGEYTDIIMPQASGFDRLGNYGVRWVCHESGPVRTVFQTAPVKTPRGNVALRLTAFTRVKRIDVQCLMLDTDKQIWRQIRLAFPINGDLKKVAYEVPFGTLEVGKGELDPALAFGGKKAVRPREVQNWICAGDDKGAVTIGSSVTAWDYMEVSDKPADYPILQPVMLSTPESVNGGKRYWMQPGDHSFTFSIYSHQPGWRNGWRLGVQANNPLIAVAQKEKQSAAALPEVKSFLSISAPNMTVTAVKKSEDGNHVIVRFYETLGEDDTTVTLNLHGKLSGAVRTNLIEEDAEALEHVRGSATLKVGRHSIETIRLKPGF